MSAIASYFKALYFQASAAKLKDKHLFPSVILMFDSLLHLGIGMCLWDAVNLEATKLTKRLAQDLKHAKKKLGQREAYDPAKALSYQGIQDYLAGHKTTFPFLEPFHNAFCELRGMRTFVHYGPRLLYGDHGYIFRTSLYPQILLRDRLFEYISKSELYFRAYYELVEAVTPGNWVFLHLPHWEDLWLYSSSSEGLPSYYSISVRRLARQIHAKFRDFGKEGWKCRCVQRTRTSRTPRKKTWT